MPTYSPAFRRLIAIPIQFVVRKDITAVTSVIGRKARYNNDCILKSASEKGRAESMPKIVVGIALRSMNDNERTSNFTIFDVQRIGTINKDP